MTIDVIVLVDTHTVMINAQGMSTYTCTHTRIYIYTHITHTYIYIYLGCKPWVPLDPTVLQRAPEKELTDVAVA